MNKAKTGTGVISNKWTLKTDLNERNVGKNKPLNKRCDARKSFFRSCVYNVCWSEPGNWIRFRKRDEVKDSGEEYTSRSSMICPPHPVLFRWSYEEEEYTSRSSMICPPHPLLFRWSYEEEEGDGRGMWHVCGTWEVHTRFWWGNLKERNHMADLGVDGRIILRRIFRKWDGETWLGWSGLGQEHVAGCCECGNEISDSIKSGIDVISHLLN